MVATTGAAALEVGIAVDLTGVGNCEAPDTVRVTDTVGVAAPVGEATRLVAVGLGEAWPAGGAVD